MVQKTKTKARKADQYDDPNHDYLKYWEGRDYENESEDIAIRYFLNGKHFSHAVDVGGGYGRVSKLLTEYSNKVTLAEPSKQQLDIAKKFLKGVKKVEQVQAQAADLKYKDGSIDLIVMIRVMHHLPDPSAEFKELARVLSDEGYFILEVANYTHFLNRVKHIAKMRKFPKDPVDIRSREHKNAKEIAFVNHNPRTVINQLSHAGFKVEQTLSVSNLRNPSLKKLLPKEFMLNVERMMQKPLGRHYFGPSTFFLVRKAKTNS